MRNKKSLIVVLSLSNLCLFFLINTAYKSPESPLFASISLDKMNVIYLGVDNPLTVTMAGISNEAITLSSSDLRIRKINNGKYILHGIETGTAEIVVKAPNVPKQVFTFRVKGMPNPTTRLGNQNSGALLSGTFKAQAGIGAWIDNFDIDARCKVISFDMTWVSKDKDPITLTNLGARFQKEANELIMKAKVGDRYFFDQVRAKCPGDKEARLINSLAFSIK